MILFALSGAFIVMIMAASWAPDSQMTKLRWIPGWAARLADRDPNIRTAIPFIPLAFLLVRGFVWRGVKWPLGWAVLVSGVCLGLSELGQRFLPHRTADVNDLMWGGAGIALGTVLAWGRKRW
ncbi:MAG: VanZ family protein [Akkermansiaceae bacterium]|nr:VanZ family protein [Akkermansiaceae bacterium]